MTIPIIILSAIIGVLQAGVGPTCLAGSPYIWTPSYSREINAAGRQFQTQRDIQRIRDLRMNADLQRRMRSLRERVSTPASLSPSTRPSGRYAPPTIGGAQLDRDSRAADRSKRKAPLNTPDDKNRKASSQATTEPTSAPPPTSSDHPAP